jgi:putative acetyltransferase
MLVRSEEPSDLAAIRFVNEQAFGRREEADLVDRLRVERVVLASFVAEAQGQLVGHILFSRISIEMAGGSVPAVALAPLAVLPKLQRQGIGNILVSHGLDWLRGGIEEIVLVLGHPEYYARFGFSTQKARFLDSPFDAKAFMALELKPDTLRNIRGSVRYPDAFGI